MYAYTLAIFINSWNKTCFWELGIQILDRLEVALLLRRRLNPLWQCFGIYKYQNEYHLSSICRSWEHTAVGNQNTYTVWWYNLFWWRTPQNPIGVILRNISQNLVLTWLQNKEHILTWKVTINSKVAITPETKKGVERQVRYLHFLLFL